MSASEPEEGWIPEFPGTYVEVRPCDVGGGRGVFAKRDIPSGTVILVEKPFLDIPYDDDEDYSTDEEGDAARRKGDGAGGGDGSDGGGSDRGDPELLLHSHIARHIVRLAHTASDELWGPIATGLSGLHPRSLDVLSEEERSGSEEHCKEDAARIWDEVHACAGRVPDEDGKGRDGEDGDGAGDDALRARAAARGYAGADDTLLALLKMRLNAFGTGVYTLASLVNHRCLPNCKKFGHEAGEGPGGSGEAWTEIVVVTPVPAGTELTISYIDPIERSHAGRVRAFREQHFADPGATPFPPESESLPSGKHGEENDVLRVALEEEIDTVGDASDLRGALDMEARAIELFGPSHLVTLRARSHVIPACLAAMDDDANPADTIEPALSLVRTAIPLLEAQECILGREHCDVATTMQDIAMAIEHLLSTANGDKSLFAAFPEKLGTFGRASSYSFRLQKRSKEIQDIYSRGEQNPMP